MIPNINNVIKARTRSYGFVVLRYGVIAVVEVVEVVGVVGVVGV